MKLNRISLKISLFVSLTILLAIILMAKMVLSERKKSLVSGIKIRALSYAVSAREAMTPRMDLFNLHLAVNTAAGEKGVAAAFVRDASGKILSHSSAERIGEVYAEHMPEKKPLSWETRSGDYVFSVPIMLGEKRMGDFSFLYSEKSIASALSAFRRRILATAGLSVVFAMAGVILIVNWMMRPIHILADAAHKVGEGNFDVRVDWKGSDEMGLLTSAFNRMLKGLRERDYIKRVFGRYVSREIAETLLSGKLALGGETREIAVLFADIRDFSKLTIEREPQEIVSLLNGYFSMMTRVVRNRNGIVDKFIGDGMLAIFGAPLVLDNPCEKAVKAALEMKWALSTFNKDREIKGLSPLRIGICVTYGKAVVGNIGSDDRAEYTAIGEPVNLAVRLEGLNKRLGTDFIVPGTVCEKISGSFKCVKLGEFDIRSWPEPLDVYEIAG